MRIALVAPLVVAVPPLLYGGTERVISALAEVLVGQGHEVALYASGDSRTSARLVPMVEEAVWTSNSGADAQLLHLAELARVTREAADFDVIHSHLDCLAFPFGRLSATPFLHTMHGRLDFPETIAVLEAFPDAMLVSISNSQRQPVLGANWIGTVYNGISLTALPFGDGHGGYLVFLGRISAEKGVADAIDVANAADLPLKIAARMPLANVQTPWVAHDWAYYNDEVKPRLDGGRVEFIGEVGELDKGALLKDAMAMIFPINWPEPFGLVMAEALACGTPVIARSVGAAPEIIDHGRTGFLCADVGEMVASCRRVAAIDRRLCRTVAEERFSSDAMTRGYLAAYRAVQASH